jgi:hypothetical protein
VATELGMAVDMATQLDQVRKQALQGGFQPRNRPLRAAEQGRRTGQANQVRLIEFRESH